MRNVNGEPKMLLKQLVHPFFILLQDLIISFGILVLLVLSFSEVTAYVVLFFLIFVFPLYLYSKKN